MIVKDITQEDIIKIHAIRCFYQKRHILLIGMGMRERNRENNTAFDIQRAFNISKVYAWKLLGELKKEKFIESSEKLKQGNQYYHNYKLTESAKDILQILSSWLYSFNGAGKKIGSVDNCYSHMLCPNLEEELIVESENEASNQDRENEENST